MNPTFARAVLSAACLAFSLGAVAQQKSSEIPVETFQKRPENQNMLLSPNGDLLAAVTPLGGRDNLVVVDLKKRSRTVITSFKDYDVVQIRWISNKRIFFRVADGRDALGRIEYVGAYAIDVDGNDVRDLNRLVFGSAPTALERRPQIVPYRSARDGDDMFVGMTQRRREALDIYLLNTRTGATSCSPRMRPPIRLSGCSTGTMSRVTISYDPTVPKEIVWYRDDAKGPWRVISEWKTGAEVEEVIRPLGFTEDNKGLYVTSNIGRERAAIFKFDPQTKKLGELVFEHPLIELEGGLQFERTTGKLLGINYDADKPGVPGSTPSLTRSRGKWTCPCREGERAHARLGEPQAIPGLLDLRRRFRPLLPAEHGSLGMEELMPTRPWLKPELMSPVKYMPYKARDGLEIPAWVTIPKESSGRACPRRPRAWRPIRARVRLEQVDALCREPVLREPRIRGARA